MFTESDLTSIEAAIKTGTLSVSLDGKMVTYRSMSDLIMARDLIKRDINAPRFLRSTYAATSKG